MIAKALRDAAEYVDDHAETSAGDGHRQPTEAQRAVKADKVRAVAQDLRALADASETRRVAYVEYQNLKDRLYAFGFVLMPELEQEIVAAFREAAGPMSPLEKGWMKFP